MVNVLISLLAAASAVAASPQTLTVIATTDFHGALVATPSKTATGDTVSSGGAAVIASYVKVLRANAKGPTILVDAGDLFQGTLESNLPEGAPVVRFYNAMNVAAAAVGNHEFDFGPVGEKSVPTDPSDDPQGALKARAAEAHFPFLAANITDDAGNTPSWLKKSVVYDLAGVRVGIVGAATPDTPNTTVKLNLKGLRFLDAVAPVLKEAQRLRSEEKADVVILTMHGGGACKDNALDHQDDLSTCDGGEIFQLLKALPAGTIDVAVAGHTHQGIAKRVGSTVIVQAYSHGQQVAWVEVPVHSGPGATPRVAGFEPVCGTVVDTPHGPACQGPEIRTSRGPVRGARFLGTDIVPDAEVTKLISPDVEKVRAIKQAPIGVTALTTLTRSYGSESALGNLIADVLRASVDSADVAVTNDGGLRADIPEGPVLYGHIFEVLPFDNRVATVDVSGAVLRKMVELGHAGPRGALSWSRLSFTADGCTVTGIQVGGQPLDPTKIYRVVTNDYLAGGGSGFDGIGMDPTKSKVFWDGPWNLRDVTAGQLKSWNRDLRSVDYFDPSRPRQTLTGSCKQLSP